MAALLAPLAESAGTALVGKIAGKAVPRDPATVVVRVGRFTYGASVTYIALLWYWGWRNERVAVGDHTFPIPGLYKGGKIQDGAPDADDASDVTLGTTVSPSPAVANTGPLTTAPGTDALGPIFPGGSPSGNNKLLDSIAHVAQGSFGLHVGENPRFGGVSPVHVPTSYHYKGRAFDASGDPIKMAAFANWVAQNYGPQITELFWRGTNWVIIKNGVKQSNYNFVTGHTDHVHVAI